MSGNQSSSTVGLKSEDFSLSEIEKLLPNGVRVSHFTVGSNPAVNVFHGIWPPNTEVDPHTHGSDYCEIVLAGKQRVGKKWYEVGDVRTVKGGTNYGPLSTGPDGCTILIIFAGDDWIPQVAKRSIGKGLYVDNIEKLVSD